MGADRPGCSWGRSCSIHSQKKRAPVYTFVTEAVPSKAYQLYPDYRQWSFCRTGTLRVFGVLVYKVWQGSYSWQKNTVNTVHKKASYSVTSHLGQSDSQRVIYYKTQGNSYLLYVLITFYMINKCDICLYYFSQVKCRLKKKKLLMRKKMKCSDTKIKLLSKMELQ